MLFEIVKEIPRESAPSWSRFGGDLLSLLTKGRNLLETGYVFAAKSVLQSKENLEDSLAERKARQRIQARLANAAKTGPERFAAAAMSTRPSLKVINPPES